MRSRFWLYRWRCAPMALALLAVSLAAGAAHGQDRGDSSVRGTTRLERRSQELAIPDEYLDPQWPTEPEADGIVPEESDSVENVPLEADRPDAAEQEELQRYKEALGLEKKPDDFNQDNWGQTPRQSGPGEDEPRDPANW